jgi:hypothetical protein
VCVGVHVVCYALGLDRRRSLGMYTGNSGLGSNLSESYRGSEQIVVI